MSEDVKSEPVSDPYTLDAVDHAVITRCVERQPEIYIRGQHEGYYIHSDVAALIGMIGRARDSAPASDDLEEALSILQEFRNYVSSGVKFIYPMGVLFRIQKLFEKVGKA